MDAVVFDFGGVLVDWNPRYLYRELMADDAEVERFLTDVCPSSWNEEMDRGKPFAQAIAERVALFPERAAMIRAYGERWIDMIGGPIEGSVRLLRRLHERGTPLYGLTNWSAETFPLVRDDPAYDFFALLRGVVVSGEVGMIKPDPAIFAHLAERFDLAPDRCLFIDDNRANIESASACGWRAVRFETPTALEKDLEAAGLL